jgi:hypothetical protein
LNWFQRSNSRLEKENNQILRTEKESKGEDMHVVVIVLMAMLILSNCDPRVIPGPVYLYPKVEPVDIELKSFSFYPNHIAILRDQSNFIFRLKNTAQIKHNFTLIDRRRNILINVDLMPDESTIVTDEPLEPGNYTFYCNRFLHRRAGMEGMLMVAE